MIFTLVGCSAL